MLGIEAVGLSKTFGSLKAVEDLSLSVPDGQVLALLGPNGAGKTTTIRMLACLITPTSGTALVAGYDVLKQPALVRRSVGVLTESPSLYERLTAEENLEFFAKAYGVTDPAERRLRISHLLEILGLWERRNDRVATYSKGMRQKLAFARAILHKPPVLFLDEPTSNLDPSSARLLREEIHSMSKREGRSILLSTHRLEDVERLADRVIILRNGKLLAEGSPHEVEGRVFAGERFEVKLKAVMPEIRDRLLGVEGVKEVYVDSGAGMLNVTCESIEDVVPRVVRKLVMDGYDVLSVKEVQGSLEDAYLKLVSNDSENVRE